MNRVSPITIRSVIPNLRHRVMPKKISPALTIMSCLLLWAIGDQLWSALAWGHDSFQLTEWLINYSGGFVRRGLAGTMIGIAASLTGIQANYLTIGLSTACYLILGVWYLRRSTRTFPAILILSCIVIGFPAYQDSIVRKDCLGLLLLLACLKIDHSRLPRHFAIAAINLIAVAAILCHESFMFFGLPALVFYGPRDASPWSVKQLLRRGLALLPAVLCCACVAVFHGTPRIAEAVNASWLPLWRTLDPGNPQIQHASAAIQALGWSSQQGLSLGITLLTSGIYQPLAWATVFGISFVLFLIFTGRTEERSLEVKARVTALLVAQFLFISPLFLLGFDYGRWLFFWVASTVMIETEQQVAPRWLVASVERLFAKARIAIFLTRIPAKDWYLLFFGVPVCWNIHNFMVASPICRHLYLIWMSLK